MKDFEKIKQEVYKAYKDYKKEKTMNFLKEKYSWLIVVFIMSIIMIPVAIVVLLYYELEGKRVGLYYTGLCYEYRQIINERFLTKYKEIIFDNSIHNWRLTYENWCFNRCGTAKHNWEIGAKISKIKGNADFSNSYVTNLGALEYIGGNVSFKDSQNINLSKLKMIDGNADFTHSKILNLSKLKAINGSAVFNRAFIRNLGNLKYIGKNADFCDSRVEDLGELRAIEGDAKFASCPLVSLNKLKTIGGNANFRFSQVRDLSKLKSIYGCADFRGCTIHNSGRLKLINGDVYISDLSELFPVSINVDLKNVIVKGETYVEKV